MLPRSFVVLLLVAYWTVAPAVAFVQPTAAPPLSFTKKTQCDNSMAASLSPEEDSESSRRRQFLVSSSLVALATTTTLSSSSPAHASSRAFHTTHKLKQARRLDELPRRVLPSGVSFQDVRRGRGGVQVRPGSVLKARVKVVDGMTTKPFKQVITVGSDNGDNMVLHGFEEGLLGMRLHGARRIRVPARVVEQGAENGQLPLLSLSQLKDLEKGDVSFDVEIVALK